MNERYVFVIASLVAELSASVLFFLLNPSSPLTAGAVGPFIYAVQHLTAVALIWIVVGLGAWIYSGSHQLRLRQSLSGKLIFLAKLGITGALIDNAVSMYQLQDEAVSRNLSAASKLGDFAERTLIFAIAFAAVIGISFLFSRKRRPIVTPPPRFGRE